MPSLVLGHTICFKREDGIKAGGFVEEFVGWGHDDIAFATRMIAKGLYIIPCINAAAYHINHSPHSGSMENKLKEFKTNFNRYISFVDQDESLQKFKPHKIKKLGNNRNMTIYEGP